MGWISAFRLEYFIKVYKTSVFVETGTGMGGGIKYAAANPRFSHLYSCEIEKELYEKVKNNANERITIFNQKSDDFLKNLIPKLEKEKSCLFWFDAHYPGADFGLKKYDTEKDLKIRWPLEDELKILCSLRDTSRDVLIIDDLRIYEQGKFQDGPCPEEAKGLPPEKQNINFVVDLFKSTHLLKRDYRHTGYVVLTPKMKACSDLNYYWLKYACGGLEKK